MRSAGHHHRLRLRGAGYFRRLGPGLVTGAADDDPSGIGTYSQAGAGFGFALLWTAPVMAPLAAAVQEATGRLGLVTGKGLATNVREHFSRPVLHAAVALVAVANIFNIGADLGSMAAALRLLVPVPPVLGVVLVAAVVLALELFVSYARYALLLRWLVLSLLTYVGVLAVVTVDWPAVLRATVLPTLRLDRPYLAALVALFGTTISPYLFFWQAGEEVEEETKAGAGDAAAFLDSGHVRAMRGDVVGGMASAVGVAFAIMVATAVTLHPKGITTITTAEQAAPARRPGAGPAAARRCPRGIRGPAFRAVPVLAGSTGYAVAESLGRPDGLNRPLRQAPLFYGTVVLAVLVGIGIDFVGVNPIRALYWSAILNGVTAPPLILLLFLLTSRRDVMGEWRSGPWSRVLVAGTALTMTALPVAYLLA